MNLNQYLKFLIGLVIVTGLISCKKEFLEKKASSNIIVPTTLADMRALLNNEAVIAETPRLGEIACTDFYLEDATLNSLIGNELRNGYTWQRDIYAGTIGITDWNTPYQQILIANIVLEGLEKIPVSASNQKEWQSVRGAAFFYRARAFYNLAETFCLPYDPQSAITNLGIPLKLTSDINSKVSRSSLQASYDQVLSDLGQATALLSETVLLPNRLQPTKLAAWALEARIHLAMRNYSIAGKYADSVLSKYNKLIDFNTLNAAVNNSINFQNDETVLQSGYNQSTDVLRTLFNTTQVDPTLYGSYGNNDLRRTIFFKLNPSGKPYMKGCYSGTTVYFTGLAVDELYLIRAEAKARNNDRDGCLSDLNALLVKRYKTGTFTALTALTPEEALSIVLQERRKELIFRGLRWSDLRRLNRDGANITLTRVANGQSYSLPPNDPRYAMPIPDDEIAFSGITQNQR